MYNRDDTNNCFINNYDEPWQNRRIVMFPIWFFQCYLSLSVFIFAFGPWPWPIPDPVNVYIFLICAQIALYYGYKSGLVNHHNFYSCRWEVNGILKLSLLVNILWIVPSYSLLLGMQDINIINIVNTVTGGFLNPGEAYYARQDATAAIINSSALGYISILLGPILALLFPLSIFYWKKLSARFKISFILVTVINLLSWVAVGTNKGIADFVILLPFLVIAARPEIITRIRAKNLIGFFSIVIVGLILLISFFSATMKGRGGGAASTYDSSAGIDIDKDNWMVSHLPDEAQDAVSALTSYFIQGYYALSLALEEPFDFSYGIGNSYFLTGITQSFVGPGVVSDKTYPAKLEKYGWDRFGKWHSIYTWIASDLTFPGTIVFVFFIGRIFGMVWLDVLHKVNPFAVALLSVLLIMLFYFPANNQVFAFHPTATSFIVFLILWAGTRKIHVW